MLQTRRSRVFALPVCAGLLFASAAAAQEPEPAERAAVESPYSAAGAVVVPAPTLTDPKTGAQTVTVPEGCAATRQSTGQLVILCPYAAPGSPTLAPRVVRTTTKWYGWQTLIVDGAALTAATVLIGSGDGDLAGTGAGLYLSGYALGGPIVHWSNGEVGKGFASLGLRVGSPIVAGLTGAAMGAAMSAGSSDTDVGVAVGAGFGIVAGAIAAVVIDSAVLARKTVVVENEHAERARVPRSHFSWNPTAGYDPKRQAASVGLTGTF